jgi:hypothetical protein
LDPEISSRAENLDTTGKDGIIVRTQQEMDILPGAREHRAVITAHCPATNDCNFHRLAKNGNAEEF